MPTATAEARAWIDGLPGGTFFFASEVPGRPSVVRPLLSRLAADDSSPVHREMQGFYAKAWRDGDASRVPRTDRVYGALKLAGAGGGAASALALNWLGWTHQHPCRYDFAVIGRPPTSPWPFVRFRRRSNTRRHLLNWAEVTLLEGLRSFGYLECVAWQEATDMLARGICQQRLGQGVALSGRLLMQVGSAERSQPKAYFGRLADAVNALEAASAP